MTAAAHQVRDPAGSRLQLRAGLRLLPRRFGGQDCYLIEDPLRGKFFRVGLPEHALLMLLDGTRTTAEAIGQAAAQLGAQALTEAEALAVCRWLVDNELAATPESAAPERLAAAARRAQTRRWQAALHPLALRLPLLNPDAWLTRLLPWARPLLSWPATCLGGGLIAAAALIVALRWTEFTVSGKILFDPANCLRMLAVWLAAKLLHELAHGLVCKHYGGRVDRAGVMLLLFAPVAFVDVTSSWRFASKWQRIATAGAGLYADLLLAAVAVFGWALTADGLVHRTCYQAVLLCGAASLLVNANPLVRFDGYYMLADLAELPNLYARSRQYLADLARRYLLGLDVPRPSEPRWQRAILGIYAWAALTWRLLLYASLALVLVALWGNFGQLLAALLGTLWFVLPAARHARQLWRRRLLSQADPRRALRAAAVLGGAAAAVALLATRPARVHAPAVVEYAPLHVVRAGGPGFVRDVRVVPGQAVQAGDVIAVLENEGLHTRLADLALEIEQVGIRARLRQRDGDTARWQVELAQQQALGAKRRELQAQCDALVVRAPAEGRIVGRDVETLAGRYVQAGAPLAMVGNERAKELVVAVAQEAAPLLAAGRGQVLEVRLPGTSHLSAALHARLTELDPRALAEPPHPALSSQAGGPLPVRAERADAGQAPRYSLLAPHFTARAPLTAAQSAALAAGQRAEVVLTTSDESALGYWLRTLCAAVEQRLRVLRAG